MLYQNTSPQARIPAPCFGRALAEKSGMSHAHLIAIRHVEAQGRRIPVLLSRSERGSFAGRLLLAAGDAPILDGPTLESVVALIAGQIDRVLYARMKGA